MLIYVTFFVVMFVSSKIFLIRHGFTPANNAKYNNQRDLWKIANDQDMPLEKEYGEVQARELGSFLNKIEGNTLILVSPYKRALQTLDIALQEMNGEYDIEICDELSENNCGIHYAKTKEEVLELYPEAIDFYLNIENNPYEVSYIGGESDYDVRDRVEDISKKILNISNSENYANIFIFAHGTVNKWIYYWINNDILLERQKNCEVIIANGDNRGKAIFLPEAWVPLGYKVKINSYL